MPNEHERTPIPTSLPAFKLFLPTAGDSGKTTEIQNTGAVVIVGANGSGKSRIGNWLDQQSPQYTLVHRISAQKSLSIPDSVSSIALSKAQAAVWYGNEVAEGKENPWAYKIGHRWGSYPISHLLSDYEKLLVLLFSDEVELSTKYRQAARQSTARIEPPESKLDIVKRIWEKILPARKLVIGGGEIQTHPTGAPLAAYKASEMSDGERVAFYLIGQVVSAPAGAIIVIDEPELHLHKSIQSTLWDAVEDQRPDCQLVYLTHDLAFAASRLKAPKICLREFDGKNWHWFAAPENDIPEEIFLQVVGSRKPVLFVEGDRTSADQQIFSRIYPTHTVIGCGGCQRVINATTTFSFLTTLHRLECHGIIDRDFRSADEISSLGQRGISVLPVAEIENLFMEESVIQILAIDQLKQEELTAILAATKRHVLARLSDECEAIISCRVSAAVESRLHKFDNSAKGQVALEKALQTLVSDVDVSAIYSKIKNEVDRIISSEDYAAAIRLYPNKGFIAELARLFGMKRHDFLDYIYRLLRNTRGTRLVECLQQLLPTLPVQSSSSPPSKA
jgi:energy-coupling factor transporter ATP-binding protein EcfA2